MAKNGQGNEVTPPPTKITSKIYQAVIRGVDKFVPGFLRPLWMHPAGPKTVFFWGPIIKWGLVIAGLGDAFSRPPEVIAIQQNASIAITGVIWSRYSVVITPKNYSLLACNMSVTAINSYQIFRALNYKYQQEQKNK